MNIDDAILIGGDDAALIRVGDEQGRIASPRPSLSQRGPAEEARSAPAWHMSYERSELSDLLDGFDHGVAVLGKPGDLAGRFDDHEI